MLQLLNDFPILGELFSEGSHGGEQRCVREDCRSDFPVRIRIRFHRHGQNSSIDPDLINKTAE